MSELLRQAASILMAAIISAGAAIIVILVVWHLLKVPWRNWKAELERWQASWGQPPYPYPVGEMPPSKCSRPDCINLGIIRVGEPIGTPRWCAEHQMEADHGETTGGLDLVDDGRIDFPLGGRSGRDWGSPLLEFRGAGEVEKPLEFLCRVQVLRRDGEPVLWEHTFDMRTPPWSVQLPQPLISPFPHEERRRFLTKIWIGAHITDEEQEAN